MQPPWFKLLRRWQEANRFGLTLPFVFGALDRWPGSPLGSGSTAEKLAKLVRDLAEGTGDGDVIRLFTCGTVRDLTLAPVFGTPAFCVPIRRPGGPAPTLWVQRDLLDADRQSCEGLSEMLWSRYGQELLKGHYSLRNRVFGPFSEPDLTLIASAMAVADDDHALDN